MKPLLRNLVEMTGQRDHLRLEVSVLSTLMRLGNVVTVQALELFQVNDVLHFRPRTWRDGQEWVTTPDALPVKDARSRPVTELPMLVECLRGGLPYTCAVERKGRHIMWLPLWSKEKAEACLEVVQSTPFSSHRIEVISSIFQVYQNYQSLLDYSERDALTGLYNRKTFDEQFARTPYIPHDEERESEPSTLPSSVDDDALTQGDNEPRLDWLAVVDIDHFKLINDRFGHLYGDEVLILMANLLRSSFRTHDKVFRFGGEEFVVLLRNVSLATARKAFERFRMAVQDSHFPQVGTVTVSIGFTSVTPGSPVETLGHADQALYYAKDNGRNNNAFYGDLVTAGLLQSRIDNADIELF